MDKVYSTTVRIDGGTWQVFNTDNRHSGPMATGHFSEDGRTIIDESDYDNEELVFLLVEGAVNGQL